MLPAPTSATVQGIATRAYNWVKLSRRPAPRDNGQAWSPIPMECVSMYRSLPITFKVPPGYSIPGADSTSCYYVRHLGNQMYHAGANVPQVNIELIYRRQNQSYVKLIVSAWPDGQPDLEFYVARNYAPSTGRTKVDIYYPGKPSGDSRKYPIQMYWGSTKILQDHRTVISGAWIYQNSWGAASGQKGNKYFIRTEDNVAEKLLHFESDFAKLYTWCNTWWGQDLNADIHAPLFNLGNDKRTDQIYQPGAPVYRDCVVTHDGCINNWPTDRYRGQSAGGWGFSHRSKVCFWQGGYTWILAQDPLGLQAQAIHTLNKTNVPTYNFYDAWPFLVPGKPAAMTPVGIATWMKDNYYRPGVGATMWSVPLIGGDNRISSLRTNQMLILTTLLGYKHRIAGWAAYADELANILCQVSVGGENQPSYGVKTAELGNICRPDYYGAQLYVWDLLDGSGVTSAGTSQAGVGVTGLGLVDFGWLRQTLNQYFNLPVDDEDFVLSTIETTATYCQALRVYLWHKYRVLIGASSTIPGY